MEMLKGTEWWPELDVWKNGTLFFETSEEKPRPEFVRYWLQNYAAMGILRHAKGIIMGRPCDNCYVREYEAELLKVLDEEGRYDLPVIIQMDFGHTCPVFTIPYGLLTEVNCMDQTFRCWDPASYKLNTARLFFSPDG